MKLEYNITSSSKNKLSALIKDVLLTFKPSKKEVDEVRFATNEVMGRLLKAAPKDVEILLAGSSARGTQLRGNSDVDIFLLFPRSMNDKVIEKKGLEIAKKIVNKKKNESYIVKYAEHPYTRLFLKDLNINVDIVPAYKIEHARNIGTAVDRTQLHNEFINSYLTDKQRDEVVVLKAFLKSHRIYGAEARTEGFSGYLCELLVYNYGSFLSVLTNITNIKFPVIINAAKKDLKDPELVKKFGKNFIVIDPTDPDRNVAANVSDESLFRFVLISRNLLNSPDKKTFYGEGSSDVYSEKKLLGINDMLGTTLYVLRFEVPNIADDIIWQQTKKTRTRLEDALRHHGFNSIISLQNTEEREAVIGFFICNINIGSVKIVGPSLKMGEAVEKFLKSHKGGTLITIENDRICSIEKAKYANPEMLIRSFLNNKSTKLPSNLNPRKSALYVNVVPEKYAKLICVAYTSKFSI